MLVLRRRLHRIRLSQSAVIIAQHKPMSFLSPSTAPMGNKRFARDLLDMRNLRGSWDRPVPPRDIRGLLCAGRLDADSSGLLLWTDSHELHQHIIGSDTPIEKEYLVRVSGDESWSEDHREESLELMRSGEIILDGRRLLPARVKRLKDHLLQITLREGMHRQIRYEGHLTTLPLFCPHTSSSACSARRRRSARLPCDGPCHAFHYPLRHVCSGECAQSSATTWKPSSACASALCALPASKLGSGRRSRPHRQHQRSLGSQARGGRQARGLARSEVYIVIQQAHTQVTAQKWHERSQVPIRNVGPFAIVASHAPNVISRF